MKASRALLRGQHLAQCPRHRVKGCFWAQLRPNTPNWAGRCRFHPGSLKPVTFTSLLWSLTPTHSLGQGSPPTWATIFKILRAVDSHILAAPTSQEEVLADH